MHPPANVAVSSPFEAISVSWSTSNYNAFQVDSILTGFKVRLSDHSNMDVLLQQHEEDATTLSTTFSGLQPGEWYYVQVCATVTFNTHCGPWSTVVYGRVWE